MAAVADASQKPAVVEPTLNFSTYPIERSLYSYHQILPQDGSNTSTMPVSGGSSKQWEINSGHYNLGRSYIQGWLSIPEVNTKYILMSANLGSIFRQITLTGRNSGSLMCDINNLNMYLNGVLRHEMPIDEIKSRDCLTTQNAAATAPTAATGVWETMTMLTTSEKRLDAGTTRQSGGTTGNEEPSYTHVGPVGDGALGGNINVAFRFRLGDIVNSCFIDKSLYFPENITLRVIFDGSTSLYITANDNNFTTPVAAAGTVSINNLSLNLCREDNPMIQQKLRDAVEGGGLRVPIRWVETTNNTITGAGNHNFTNRFSRMQGKSIAKYYWVPFDASGTAGKKYLHNNLSQALFTTYFVNIDGRRVNERTYTCSTADDYYEQRHRLKGSCIRTAAQYYYNFAHCIDFTTQLNKLDELPANIPRENVDAGLSLDSDHTIDIQCAAAATISHYGFLITNRTMLITNRGIYLDPTNMQ